MSDEIETKLRKAILRAGWPIPDTTLSLFDYDAWLVVDGKPVKGRVQLGNDTHCYVTLDFVVVEWSDLYQSEEEAVAAAKAVNASPNPIPDQSS